MSSTPAMKYEEHIHDEGWQGHDDPSQLLLWRTQDRSIDFPDLFEYNKTLPKYDCVGHIWASVGPIPGIPQDILSAAHVLGNLLYEGGRDSFDFFVNTHNLRISATVYSSILRPNTETLQYLEIAEELRGESTTHKVTTRWKSINGKLELQICLRGPPRRRFRFAQSWLKARYSFKPTFHGPDDRQRLYHLWHQRHKIFRLMDLPEEIRVLIFENLIGPVIRLRPNRRTKGDGDIERNRHWPGSIFVNTQRQWRSRDPCGSRQYMLDWTNDMTASCLENLLLVSKTIHKEVQRVLSLMWKSTFKNFDDIYTMVALLPELDAIKFHTLRRVSIGFQDHEEYFRLVGCFSNLTDVSSGRPRIIAIMPRYERRDPTTNFVKAFTNLKNLAYLNFHFRARPPAERFQSEDGTAISSINRVRVLCQHIWIDAFFTLLIKKIAETRTVRSNVPMITFSGDIKKRTRREWEPIWKDFNGGIRCDVSSKFEKLIFPPSPAIYADCHCESPCEWVRVSKSSSRSRLGCPVIAEFNRGDQC